jgi:hypothetical protein
MNVHQTVPFLLLLGSAWQIAREKQMKSAIKQGDWWKIEN